MLFRSGLFPTGASFKSDTPDGGREYIFGPAFTGIAWVLAKMRWMQAGRVHLYVLYIALTLLIFLVWKVR